MDPGSLGRFVSRSYVRLGTGYSSQQHTGVMLLQQICLWLTGVLVSTAVLTPQAAPCWLGSEWAVLAASWEAPVSTLLSTPGLCDGVCCLELQRCPHPYLLTYVWAACPHTSVLAILGEPEGVLALCRCEPHLLAPPASSASMAVPALQTTVPPPNPASRLVLTSHFVPLLCSYCSFLPQCPPLPSA